MTQWTPQLEADIRKLGDLCEKQVTTAIDPEKNAVTSTLSFVFRDTVQVVPLLKRINKKIEGEYVDAKWQDSMEKIVAIAEANNSDAAGKIKKSIPVGREMSKFWRGYRHMISSTKAIKKLNLKY